MGDGGGGGLPRRDTSYSDASYSDAPFTVTLLAIPKLCTAYSDTFPSPKKVSLYRWGITSHRRLSPFSGYYVILKINPISGFRKIGYSA